MKREARRVMYLSGNWSRAHYFRGTRGRCACGKFTWRDTVSLPVGAWVKASFRCFDADARGLAKR